MYVCSKLWRWKIIWYDKVWFIVTTFKLSVIFVLSCAACFFWQCVKSNRTPRRDHCLFLCLFSASKALILVYLISCSLYNYPFKQTVFVDPVSFYPCCYYIKVALRETMWGTLKLWVGQGQNQVAVGHKTEGNL